MLLFSECCDKSVFPSHSELLSSLLRSDLLQDLALFSQDTWRLLCSQEDFWHRCSNTTGTNLTGLHWCYWLLCLDCGCDLFTFVKVYIPAVPQYASKILRWALKSQSEGKWAQERSDKHAALFFWGSLFVRKDALTAARHTRELETFLSNC